MVKSILEFRTDVEADAGHTFLVLTKEGLTSGQLLEFQIAMISQNDIPGITKIEVKEFDSNVKLCYHLNGLISLANYLKRQRVSKSDFSEILNSVIAVLLNCGNYLLNDNAFVLKEDLIYLNPKSKQISLIYLPVETECNAAAEFKSFLISLLINTATIDTKDNYVQLLLNLTKSEQFGLVEFREQLKSISSTGCLESNAETRRDGDFPWHQASRCSPDLAGCSPDSSAGCNQSLSELTVAAGSEPRADEGKGEGGHNPDTMPGGGPVKVRVRKIVLGILAVVTVIGAVISSLPSGYRTLFTWPDKATSSVFGLSLAFLLAMMAVIFLVKKNNALIAARQTQSDEAPAPMENLLLTKSLLSSAAINKPDHGESPKFEPEEANDETTFLDDTSMETSLLSDSRFPCLKAVSGEETIIISKNEFKVGRQKEITDYVIPSKNIGRIHVEINCSDNDYYITDMDSTNGTFINGSRLLSNKPYPLQPNDKVTLANLEYQFICS